MRDALLMALSTHGEGLDVRSSADRRGMLVVRKETVTTQDTDDDEAEPGAPPLAPSTDTTIEQVIPLVAGDLRLATPPLVSIQQGLLASRVPAPPLLTPAPKFAVGARRAGALAAQPVEAHPVAPAKLCTPPGRPPAPGMGLAATGILKEGDVSLANPPETGAPDQVAVEPAAVPDTSTPGSERAPDGDPE